MGQAPLRPHAVRSPIKETFQLVMAPSINEFLCAPGACKVSQAEQEQAAAAQRGPACRAWQHLQHCHALPEHAGPLLVGGVRHYTGLTVHPLATSNRGEP